MSIGLAIPKRFSSAAILMPAALRASGDRSIIHCREPARLNGSWAGEGAGGAADRGDDVIEGVTAFVAAVGEKVTH